MVLGPSMPSPIDLRSKVLSPSTVWLEWNDPTLGRVQQLTDSRYYNVHYRPLMMPASAAQSGEVAGTRQSVAGGRTLSVVVKATHIVFYDLRPGTRYEFKVRTVKDAVASEFSQTIVNKTFETGNVVNFVKSWKQTAVTCTRSRALKCATNNGGESRKKLGITLQSVMLIRPLVSRPRPSVCKSKTNHRQCNIAF